MAEDIDSEALRDVAGDMEEMNDATLDVVPDVWMDEVLKRKEKKKNENNRV